MRGNRMRTAVTGAVLVMLLGSGVARPEAWGVQGHRLVALIAADQLSPSAKLNVAWLLPDSSLAEVAVWADQFARANSQTGPWHYVNLPSNATSYDRERHCPRPPGPAGDDRWRDCVVDQIPYHQARLANRSLDRADRATALKFLVHFIGDLHQPFHALDVARGGNDIPVVAFGSATCSRSDGTPSLCNLHGIWDTTLIAHRQLSDRQYLAQLSAQITRGRRRAWGAGSPAAWAMESHALAKRALLPRQGVVDEAYFRAHISVIDKRLVQGGLRLAAALNESLSEPPPQ
ncbi:MAG: S1/P1 nuclease [Vicinamibacterales bacterium]